MKIAIVTHKLLNNYGGALQAYALQKTLRNLGHFPIGVDCMPSPMSWNRYLLSNLKTLCYKLIGNSDREFFSFPVEQRTNFFKDFYNKYLILSPVCKKYKYRILRQLKVDAVIVGSDQVWRSSFHSDRNLYQNMFLRFAKKFKGLKIAYAASFGVGYWEVAKDEEKVLQSLALKFNAISTREASGVYLCRHYLKVGALHVCDPTILLTRNDYIRLAKKPNKTNYIFAYLLDIDSEKRKMIEKIAKELEEEILIESGEDAACISVERWLGMIKGATAIITNSFHGTVLAIIMHKPFIVIGHKERGEERLHSLLSSLDLRECMVIDKEHIRSNMLKNKSINWEKVDEKLEKMRVSGKIFLQEALKGKSTEEIAEILPS